MAVKSSFQGGKGSARRYTNPETGESISRRQYDKLFRLKGTTYERLAKANAKKTGGARIRIPTETGRTKVIGPQDAAKARARAFAAEHGMTVREAQRSPEYQRLSRELSRTYKTEASSTEAKVARVNRKKAAARELFGDKIAKQRYESLFRYDPSRSAIAR